MTMGFERVRRALLIALAWAAVWAPLGVVMGVLVDPDGSMDEPWMLVGVYPGFLCGVVFSTLVAITDGRRRFDEVLLSRAGALGAASGLLVIVLPFAGLLGTPNIEHPLWRWRFAIIGAVTLLSAVSAISSMSLARMAKKRAFRDGSPGVA